MHFTGPFTFEDLTEREWLITNSLGGYASSTLCGMNTRRYHGLLIAALRPPGQRTLLVAKLEEMIQVGHDSFALSTNQYLDVIHPQGYQYLTAFEYSNNQVVSTFQVHETVLVKTISMSCGANTTRVHYLNAGPFPLTLVLTPLVNARDFHADLRAEEISFSVEASSASTVHIRPHWMPEGFWLGADTGVWRTQPAWHRNMCYAWEQRRGLTFIDNHYVPGQCTVELSPGESVGVTLSTVNPSQELEMPASLTDENCIEPIYIPEDASPEIRQLYQTAVTFLVQRTVVQAEKAAHGRTIIAGYHWFGDWGRDTMIALPGLCLTTRRFGDAAEILRTFAAARHRGLLPNLFLDSGEGEAYNAVDASLWYIYAVDRYYEATGDSGLVEELRPALEEIIHFYRDGTDFGISMDRDGLINASSPGWQLTWMDAKVGDWVVTPRMGKPVEINALWYHALRVMERWAQAFGWGGDYGALAERVRKHFTAFWNPHGRYLYDVLADTPDASMRPNQIFAVSLPFSPLDHNQALAVVQTVERYLLTLYGLRTLAPHDAEYIGHYTGNQWERDGAYHRGTVWAWLIGPYVDAYLRVLGNTRQARSVCRALLRPLLAHLGEAGIGTISEIFDGDPPHLPRGAISQAWSVAELLRVWEKCQPLQGE